MLQSESKDKQIVTKDIFEIMHNRRSIRKFLDKEIPDEVVQGILEAGIRAPFAAQLYSIVYTRNPEKIKKYKTGAYPTTKLLMVFLVDFRKLEKIIDHKKYEYNFDDTMSLWLAIQDASLVAENLILAAEAYGLGSVLLGATPLNADKICDIFEIPKDRVYPLVGLCLGYPDPSENTNIRPRYPLEHIAFEDRYKELSNEDLAECMAQMDEGYLAQDYYKKLSGKIPLDAKIREDTYDMDNYSWSEHIVRKVIQGAWSDESLLTKLKRYKFNLQ
ncbi:MAG: nitroreductase family protein [Candidatus Kariarchaeaceae archaeon]|jgi:nitroreductase